MGSKLPALGLCTRGMARLPSRAVRWLAVHAADPYRRSVCALQQRSRLGAAGSNAPPLVVP